MKRILRVFLTEIRQPFSLRRRFTLLLVLLTVTFLGVGTGISRVYNAELAKTSSIRALANLDQIAAGVEVELRRVRLLAALVAQDETLSIVSSLHNETNPSVLLQANREIAARYDLLFGIMLHEIKMVLFFYRDGTVGFFKNTIGEKQAGEMRESAWYREALEQEEGARIIDSLEPVTSTETSLQYQLSVAIRPDRLKHPDMEMIYLAVTPDFFNMIISRLQTPGEEPGSSFYAIVNQDGTVMFPTAKLQHSVNKSVLGQASQAVPDSVERQIIRGNGHAYLTTARDLERIPWRIVYFTDWDRLSAGSARVNVLAVVLLASMTAAFALFSLSLHRSILRPLEILSNRMQTYAGGEKPYGTVAGVSPEFKKVFNQFDAMIVKIDILNREIIEAERAALQFQINPHFLANTLSALRFMAMMSKSDGMKHMVEALMDMMSYQLSAPENFSTVEAEIENIRRYEYIMKVRYGDTFQVTTDIEPGMEKHPLLIMLLQPVIENAIEHGLRDIRRQGEISITVRTGRESSSRLYITIRDNGSGIPPNLLATILEPPTGTRTVTTSDITGKSSVINRGRIGLYNVHQRIRNRYGPEFGLYVKSVQDSFTEVLFVLPLEPTGDNDNA